MLFLRNASQTLTWVKRLKDSLKGWVNIQDLRRKAGVILFLRNATQTQLIIVESQ